MRTLIDRPSWGYVLLPLAAPHHRREGLVYWWPSMGLAGVALSRRRSRPTTTTMMAYKQEHRAAGRAGLRSMLTGDLLVAKPRSGSRCEGTRSWTTAADECTVAQALASRGSPGARNRSSGAALADARLWAKAEAGEFVWPTWSCLCNAAGRLERVRLPHQRQCSHARTSRSTAGSVECERQLEVLAGLASTRVLARRLQALGAGFGDERVPARLAAQARSSPNPGPGARRAESPGCLCRVGRPLRR